MRQGQGKGEGDVQPSTQAPSRVCIQSVVLQVSVHVLQDGSCGDCEYFAVQ